MNVEYDQYYQTKDLFGEPYPELITFFLSFNRRGTLLDIGCGQGRDAIALARLGFQVVAIDHSKVGIQQLQEVVEKEQLSIQAFVADIYEYSDYHAVDFILLDSMFHFGKREKAKETALLEKIIELAKPDAQIIICIQALEKKISTLSSIIAQEASVNIVHKEYFQYEFIDQETDHRSKTNYALIACQKKH